MRMLSWVRIVTRILSLLAVTLMGSVPQTTVSYTLEREGMHKQSDLYFICNRKHPL